MTCEPPQVGWPDHQGLLALGRDPWRIKDACEGTVIFGGTGSGKTSGSGRALAQSFLGAGFGGLVLCAKPEEPALWRAYAAEARPTLPCLGAANRGDLTSCSTSPFVPAPGRASRRTS